MKFMIDRVGDVIHRYDLLQKVWGYERVPTTRTVDNYILSLRKKLEDEPSVKFSFSKDSLKQFNEKLSKAVQNEDYELAAKIRDEINKRTS